MARLCPRCGDENYSLREPYKSFETYDEKRGYVLNYQYICPNCGIYITETYSTHPPYVSITCAQGINNPAKWPRRKIGD